VTLASSTPLFSYYDANYTGTSAAMSFPVNVANIRIVGMNFYTSAANSQQSETPQFFSAFIDIRNLRSN